MPTKLHGKTIRVRGVPVEWGSECLRAFLEQRYTSVPTIASLAREIDGRSQTGTIVFDAFPATLQALRDGHSVSTRLSPISGRPVRPQYLTLDIDFLGITTLFAPPEQDHKIDVIAVPGLGGHAFGSFKERAGEHMWLRDVLPFDLDDKATGQPMARVMTYGYASTVANSESAQNLEDLGTSLRSGLLPLAATLKTRPIIFIAHSLGGLVVKETLISLSKSRMTEDEFLLQATYGIVFFGVPQAGMDISSLIAMAGDGPNRFLVESIGAHSSQVLTAQQRDFNTALGGEGDAEVFCFYETLKSRTAQKNETGVWVMTGPLAFLVTKFSATHSRWWENKPEHICAVARTHSDLVKFGPNDHDYRNARERLRLVAQRALKGSHLDPASDAPFIVPYNENPDFVGRTKVLTKLEEHLGLSKQGGGLRSRVSLYGLGGIGKTQIALAYVYWVRRMCPGVSVFWVHASSAERFSQSFASIARECQIPAYDDTKTDILLLVKRWLESTDRGQWLMVLDNADDTDTFFGQPGIDPSSGRANLVHAIPECNHGKLLITTRNKQAGIKLTNGAAPINVGRMGEEECQNLMRSMLGDVSANDSDLSKLSDRLEYLPLALAQAAAFILENSITVPKYLDMQSESDQSLVDLLSEEFGTVGRDSKTPRAVAQTWVLSFQQIEQHNTLAGRLLSFMSLLDRNGVPKEFLSCYSDCSMVELTKALGLLVAFSLISEEKSGSFDMHRLVQLVTRKWLAGNGKIDQFHKEALLMMSDVFPGGGDFENRMTCGTYLPHAKAVLTINGHNNKIQNTQEREEARASLNHKMGEFALLEGKWKDAEGFCQIAMGIRKRFTGTNHPSTLMSKANLASTYRNQGRWEEAEGLFVQVMETHKAKLGEDHPHTLISMANLASTYWNQGRWEEAEKLFVQVMETSKAKLGADHPDTLTSMANLASTYKIQGRWEEAEGLEIQVMQTRKTKLGEDHPDTLTNMNNLASTFWNQGRWEEAEGLFMQVMQTRKTKLGADHPSTLTSMANLALTFWNQGRWEEAESLSVQVIETSKTKLGEDHPDTLTSISNLASTYRNQGRWEEAESLDVQVMETRKTKLGADHPDTLTSMANLASTFWNQGRWEEAEGLEIQVMETRKTKLGADHPDTLTSMANLASTFWNQGRWEEAEGLDVQVMETSKTKLGEDHPDTLTSMANLALIFWNQGRWEEAEGLFVQVMQTRKTKLGEDHPDTLTSMANLASTYMNQGRWEEAESLSVQVVETSKTKLGADHPDTLTSISNLASRYRNQGRWEEAESLDVQVMETRKTKLGADHPDTLTSMNNLAHTWHAMGRIPAAIDMMRNCIHLQRAKLGPNHHHTLSSMSSLRDWEDSSLS